MGRTEAAGEPLGARDPLAYYKTPGILTDAGREEDLISDLPTDVSELCDVIQGLLLHVFWTEPLGITLSDERKKGIEIRSVEEMLARIRELDDRPLAEPRDPDRKLVANCRGYAALLTTILRYQGVPARVRTGFAAYFREGSYEDHWVCEYWNGSEERWILVDPQIDELQRTFLNLTFDPLDLPSDQFITGGRAWLMCHAGQADPQSFGIFDLRGIGFVQGKVGQDLWCLNKVVTLPWEGWGLPWNKTGELSPDEEDALERVSTLTLDPDEHFAELRSIVENDERFRVPDDWPPR